MMPREDVKQKYNTLVGQELQGKYEQERWFRDAIQRAAFAMTRLSIQTHGFGVPFTRYLEVGPGPGTWTKEFAQQEPHALFHLVDISEEMLNVAKKELRMQSNIRYTVADFLQFQPTEKYDFFFSSRAIEYMGNSEPVVEKIVSLLQPGGRGLLITKTPKYLRQRLLRRRSSAFHGGQIAPRILKRNFVNKGCRDVRVYPVTMSVPLLRSPRVNQWVYRLASRYELNAISQFFSESYLVTFRT